MRFSLFSLLRPLLFLLPPERAHHATLVVLKLVHACGLSRILAGAAVKDPVTVFGLPFANRVGLAAGLDKNGDYIDALGALGFGFVEVGTITPLPQPGNPLPRLFRIPEREAIINRMGFNNKGVDHLVVQLQQRTYRGIVGVNIGKNATTPVENALNDYLICLNKVHAHASYITINLSSPNTPGLRSLQYGAALDNLLQGLRTRCTELDTASKRKVPLLLKIAPDLEAADIASIASSVLACGIDGVIATNTTLDRTQVAGCQHAEEAGGLSGVPVREKSTAVLRELCAQLQNQQLKKQVPVIGVGGILQASDAGEKIQAGAELVQIYSGLIYRGPGLVNAVATFLREFTHKANV